MRSRLPRCLALLALCAGCGLDGPLSVRALRELQVARARWLSSSVRNAYTFEVRQSCFCPEEFVRWHTVTVMNGVVTDARVTETGQNAIRPPWTNFLTVERIFAALFQAEDDDSIDDIRVRFDSQYGYPVAIETTAKANVADGGGAIYARNLRPVIPGP
jgi:hypothetical protein